MNKFEATSEIFQHESVFSGLATKVPYFLTNYSGLSCKKDSCENFMDYVFAVISEKIHFTVGFDNVQGFPLRLNLLQQALAGKLRALRRGCLAVTKHLQRSVLVVL